MKVKKLALALSLSLTLVASMAVDPVPSFANTTQVTIRVAESDGGKQETSSYDRPAASVSRRSSQSREHPRSRA